MTTSNKHEAGWVPGKNARLEARVTREQKALFDRAAAILGRSLTDFVVSSAQEAATRVIRDHEVMTLSDRDREVFVHALLNPPVPGKRLRQAAERSGMRTDAKHEPGKKVTPPAH